MEFRKRVGRFLITAKKRLFNDILTLNIVSIRSYEPAEVSEFTVDVYDNLKVKIPYIKLGYGPGNSSNWQVP